MFADCEHNSTKLEETDCFCTCCEQSRKPDKIIKLITSVCRSGGKLIPIAIPETETDSVLLQANIISIAAARQSAEKMRMYKLRQAHFKYPMLECS